LGFLLTEKDAIAAIRNKTAIPFRIVDRFPATPDVPNTDMIILRKKKTNVKANICQPPQSNTDYG
jgi:hypothetical protein